MKGEDLDSSSAKNCVNCLKKAGMGGCPAGGNGKACSALKTPRAKMAIYMQSLRTQVGYVSLKTKYMEQQARSFPSLLAVWKKFMKMI